MDFCLLVYKLYYVIFVLTVWTFGEVMGKEISGILFVGS